MAQPSDLVLAHHWEEAGEPRRAIHHLDRAASIAEAAQNAREAADLLARAIRLDATLDEPHSPDVVAGWHRRAGEALFEFGDPRQAIAHFRAALAQLDRPLPEGVMLAPRLLAEFWRTRRQPMGDGTPADRRARLLMAAEVLVRLSFLTYELQRHFQASYCTFRSLTLAKQAGGDSAALAIANVNMALASCSLPLIDGARHRDYAVGMAERVDEPACTLFVGWTAAAYDTSMGRFDEAVTNVRRALAAGVARRSARDVEALQVTLANTYRVLGRHWLGVEDLDAALASARDRGNVMYRIWSLGQLCRSHIARGDLDAFHRHLAEYRTMMTDGDARATASDFNRVVHATSEAQAHLVAGDPHSAARWIDEAVGIAQKIAVPQFYFMEVPGALGDALLWAWRLSPSPGLARLARRNARLARRLGRLYPGIGPQIPMTRGDLAYLSGRHGAAGRHWRAAAAEAVARGLPALEGQALGRLALPTTGADPDRARAEAEAAFARLGGTPPFPLRQVSWPPGPGPTKALP